jgi:ribosome-binding factor A
MGKQRSRSSRSSEVGAGVRGERLEELMREELNSILRIETEDPRLEGVRITFIELSRDGARARAWYANDATSDDASLEQCRAAFEAAHGFLRARLCEALPLKRSPQLTFRWDPQAPRETLVSKSDDQR